MERLRRLSLVWGSSFSPRGLVRCFSFSSVAFTVPPLRTPSTPMTSLLAFDVSGNYYQNNGNSSSTIIARNSTANGSDIFSRETTKKTSKWKDENIGIVEDVREDERMRRERKGNDKSKAIMMRTRIRSEMPMVMMKINEAEQMRDWKDSRTKRHLVLSTPKTYADDNNSSDSNSSSKNRSYSSESRISDSNSSSSKNRSYSSESSISDSNSSSSKNRSYSSESSISDSNSKNRSYSSSSGCSSSSASEMIFISPDGESEMVCDFKDGQSILDVAFEHDVDMQGACGGQCSCSTCHVILQEEDMRKFPEVEEDEHDMLDLAVDLTDTSRLGCQVKLDALQHCGIRVRLPSSTINQLLQ